MKTLKEGYRVAVVGASSLLGKELLTVLEEQAFPISRLVTFEADEEEPDLPIVDLRGESHAAIEEREVSESELDFAFLAARPHPLPAFLTSAESFRAVRQPMDNGGRTRCRVIDLTGEELGKGPDEGLTASLAEGAAVSPWQVVSVPFLDRLYPARFAAEPSGAGRPGPEAGAPSFIVSAHPAVIMISSLLLRVAARFRLERAVAQVFVSASEIGPRAIEELQKQTVGLLSFQKIPQKVFGAQLAFNLLARLGKSGEPALSQLESRLREQLRRYLGGRVPLPALRLVQVPVFYSMALSLYLETAQPVTAEQIAAALPSERLRVRRPSQDPPTQVEAVGSDDILVDAVAGDAAHPNGIWLWAVADNLRLAAMNAVEIAKSLAKSI